MKTLCYSVRLSSLERISPKAYKATAFDGSSDIIPASQVFGVDESSQKCSAWWISAWLLSNKSIQYSDKKKAWFDAPGKMRPSVSFSKHVPHPVSPVSDNQVGELKR